MSPLKDNLQSFYRLEVDHPSARSEAGHNGGGFQPVDVDRRSFFRLLGASMALAGLTGTGCRRWPVEELRPHTSRPEGFLPGVPAEFASCLELDGVATGVIVKSYDGRPIKIDGNPEHPFSKGASTCFTQASLLEMYDPERSRRVVRRDFADASRPDEQKGLYGEASGRELECTWGQFDAFAQGHFGDLRTRGGQGLALLMQPTSSPTQLRLISGLKASLPKARWFTWQPLHRDFEFAGSRSALGSVLRPQFHFDEAKLIVAFDADPLGTHPGCLRWARDWSHGRRRLQTGEMNRLCALEPSLTVTGAVADKRLPIASSRIGQCVGFLATQLGVANMNPQGLTSDQQAWLVDLAADLQSVPGKSLLICGAGQPSEVHQLVHAINEALSNIGRTLCFTEEPLAEFPESLDSIRELSGLLSGDAIQTLLILGGNPVYDAPVDVSLDWSGRRESLTTIHLSNYENETSRECTWSLPLAHFLECWGDGRAWDGTWSIQQPLILPLLDGRSPIEMLQLLKGEKLDGRAAVQTTFGLKFPELGDSGWEESLHDGLVKDSQFPTIANPKVGWTPDLLLPNAKDLEVQFIGDRKCHDGRFANNAWLQEIPDPLTKLTWDNAALISLADATRCQIATGDLIRITTEGGDWELEIPALVMPGQAQGCVTLPLGYGRVAGGLISHGIGFNTYRLRASTTTYNLSVRELERTGRRHELATSTAYHLEPSIADASLEKRLGKKGRPGMLVREACLSEYEQDHHAVHGGAHAIHAAPLFHQPSQFNSPHKWGMTIDLNACIGCSGCTMACQAENNIPVVGKQNVIRNREMHWIRVDRYFKGDFQDPDVVHVPVTCAHCENAPCEQVCPVAATVHDTEGLNGMTYNRCIGTRYCANNCPYKVRRFNYFDYQATHPNTPASPWLAMPDQQTGQEVHPLRQLMFNPEVTIRMRGVMEKCTFCVQRIAAARIKAKNEFLNGERESELVTDGEFQTACQAACPTQAIRFGDLNDETSEVAKSCADERHYEMLEELNLKARTTYLAKIRNR